MTNAFQSFNDAVTTLAENFADQAAKAAAQGMIMHGLLGGLGDIASGAMGAGPIGMAVAQGNMMVAMAHFGLQLMWLPIVLFIMGAIFTAGLSFAVIIPLTPFILFWAGKVAWILLFLEALLAAPLMALGIVYPDGHDIFGQSEPGVKLAIGMMLMPVLMVIGLLMGITLTYVVIDFTAVGFKTVMQSVLGMSGAITTAPETTQGIISCFLILFYSYILIMAFEKCFSAIHVLPEKVLQWIGIQGQKFGDQEGQQMRSQMQQAGKEGSQAGGQSATQGMQATEQAGKAQGEAAFKKQEAWMGSVNRAADSSRGSMVGSLR
jgi:conjugal transfer/type IV secretion protein DotA/TraY